MSATFQSLAETRLPKAEKAVSLLKNLVRYAHGEQEARDLVNALSAALDEVDAAFAKKWGWDDPEPVSAAPEPAPRPASIPQGKAEGGASFEAEIRWALDAIRRGDKELADNRLSRVLTGLDNDEIL